MDNPNIDDNGRRSVARAGARARLTAFDDVKRELALAVLLAVCLALVVVLLELSPLWELLLIAAVGSGCGAWVWWRARAVYRRLRRQVENKG
jgi:hypothetical protein